MSDYDEGWAKDGECPYCGSRLQEAVRGRFQRMTEHVLRPNRRPPERQSYGCPNLLCEANLQEDGPRDYVEVWLADGEGPYLAERDAA